MRRQVKGNVSWVGTSMQLRQEIALILEMESSLYL